MSRSALFSRWTMPALALGAATLLLTLFFLIFGENGGAPSFRADTYSRSAIGHQALMTLLQRRVPVLISRGQGAARAASQRPLLLLEPDVETETDKARLAAQLRTARAKKAPVVIVLPKWRGHASPQQPQWVTAVELLKPAVPTTVLEIAAAAMKDAPARVLRPADPGSWSSQLGTGGAAPDLDLPALQLIAAGASGLTDLVTRGDGILIARAATYPLYLVADPDLLNTRGIVHGENAALTLALLIDELAPAALIVEEGVHGYHQAQSVWRALIEPPLLPFSLHLAVLTALLLWAGSGRFGRPVSPPPRVLPGKLTLVDNTVRLFAMADVSHDALARYLHLAVERAAQRLRFHHPQDGFEDKVAALARSGRQRGVETDIESLAQTITTLPSAHIPPRRVLALARALYRWQKEILHGKR